MELYTVRHGQSMGNMSGDYSTPAHDRLSPAGWQQAERLVDRLAAYAFDAICVSPLRRAVETITPYLQHNGAVAEVWPELAEACWQTDRDAAAPVRTAAPRLFEVDPRTRDRFVPRRSPSFWAPHGETYQEGLARIAWVKEALLCRHGGRPETILVVGHEYAGSRLIEMLLDMEPLGRFDLANAGLSRVGQRLDGSLVARFVNRM